MQLNGLSASLPATSTAAGIVWPVPGYRPENAPPDLLRAFALRMASHGEWISSAMMCCDRRYALQQLASAHCTGDDTLRAMAMALFRDFENPAWALSSPCMTELS